MATTMQLATNANYVSGKAIGWFVPSLNYGMGFFMGIGTLVVGHTCTIV